jgi:hypothetical protein
VARNCRWEDGHVPLPEPAAQLVATVFDFTRLRALMDRRARGEPDAPLREVREPNGWYLEFRQESEGPYARVDIKGGGESWRVRVPQSVFEEVAKAADTAVRGQRAP